MTNQTILITGASAGIGEAIAKRFGQDTNSRLILCGRNRERLEGVKKSLKAPAHILSFDTRNAKATHEALEGLPQDFRDIDMLINNAGAAYGMELAQRGELNDWDAMVDTNIKGLLYPTHAILPKMVERNRGHIINIGSIAGFYAYAGGNVYGATKAFVHQFSQNLRADLLGTNLRVSTVAPGLVETGFFETRFKGDKDRVEAVFKGLTALAPQDIAEAVYWCAAQPPHVNVSLIEVMPTCQAAANIAIHRQK